MKTFRTLISFFMSFLIVQPYALAATPAHQLSVAEKIEIVRKAKPKTLGDFWQAVKPHVRSDIHARYAKFLEPYKNVRLPKMRFSEDKIEILHKGKVTTVWVNHVKDGSLRVNKKLIWHDYAGDPKATVEAMEEALSSNEYSFIESLFMPEAQAFSFLTLILGALGGWLLSMWYSPTEAGKDIGLI